MSDEVHAQMADGSDSPCEIDDDENYQHGDKDSSSDVHRNLLSHVVLVRVVTNARVGFVTLFR